ncbi:acyl-CoA dehydrogenase family protein [Streptomyces sp.]|uniref:acyl-CoA dehydrogenase family protein n=1 Tax=Streptomyces sp. TaxID=1931 RepID=UPI002D571AC8|nr:acyl-CoA dehydrogenase family protein [Streptomyces sp.]HZF90757.1 acyl-CoA dehydrogenase family protein [Streptomyces sp.]
MTDLIALMADLEEYLGDPWDASAPMPYPRILGHDEDQRYPHEFVDLLADWGLYDWIVPAANGGKAVNVEDGFNLYRLVGRRDPTSATAMVLTSLSYMPVWIAGSPAQRQHFADAIRGGRKLAWGLSERRHGSDVLANETTARRTDGGWLLNGEKWTIGNATVASTVMVFARTSGQGGPGGYSIFAVEKDGVPPGQLAHLPDEPLHGLRGLDMSGVRLTDCFVPGTALIGRVGQGLEVALKSSQLARIAIAGIAMACVDTALRTTLDFAGRRVIFGGTVAEVPYSRRQLAESFAELLIADALTTGAVRSLQLAPAQASVWSSVVKYFVPTLLEETLARLTTVLGARHYLRAHPRHGIFQKVLRDFAISNFADGNTVVNLKNIALQLNGLLANAAGQEPGEVARARAAVAELFDPARPMPPYEPAAQQLFSRAGDDSVLALRSAVGELRRAAEAAEAVGGRDAARLAGCADTAGQLADEVHRLAGEHAGLFAGQGRAAGQSAELYDLAKQYSAISAAAACVHLHLHGQASLAPALRSPAVLLLCLERLLRRFHPTRRVTGPDDIDTVAAVLAEAHREGRLFSFRPYRVGW